MARWHEIGVEQVLEQAGVSLEGLSRGEAQQRLARDGENRLPQPRRPGLGRRFLTQLSDPMVRVLLLAAGLSALLGEWADAAIIAVVVLANAALSLYQEGRAQAAAAALARLTAATARCRRGGAATRLPAEQLVAGDIVLLQAGDVVPADVRLLEAHELQCDESSLSGESLPSAKVTDPCPAQAGQTPLSDRHCLAFMGCPVTRGRGLGLVVATGADTVMGRMAQLLDSQAAPATPLQRRLSELSQVLSWGVGLICLLVFLLSLLTSHLGPLDSFLLAVSLAVAAVPEGLPVVVTLVLSLGLREMSKKNALVRRLSAVEGLGAVRVICADKTGTLTQNRMTVTEWLGPAAPLAQAAALCSQVELDGEGRLRGEPTETALAAFAAAWGLRRDEALELQPLLSELPFDSGRKLMSTLHQQGGAASGLARQYTKGAFERVLDRCTQVLDQEGRLSPLSRRQRESWLARGEEMAARGLRVLAAACREVKLGPGEPPLPQEQGLSFIGLYGISDPPREGAAQAVAEAKAAGVLTVMISGDNAATAAAIARQVGILEGAEPEPPAGETGEAAGQDRRILSGQELARMSDQELKRRLPQVRVFARVAPEDKLRIVGLWRQRGLAVAMTGDGVNDAPALNAADIGVAMGAGGAEVCRAAASLVLADDDYSTIVAAIREGRRIYDNIRRAVQFLLASNLAEVLAILVASLFGLRLFLPVHLLWINLITDCLPAAALGLEAAAPGVMRRPPRGAGDSLFSGGMAGAVLRQGCYMAMLTLAAFLLGGREGPLAATSMAFITLSAAELFQAWNMRSRESSIFSLPTANPLLALAIISSFALNLLLLYLPPLAQAFSLAALSPGQLLAAAGLAFAIVPLVELEKWLTQGR